MSDEVGAIRGGLVHVHVPSRLFVHEGCSCPPRDTSIQCQTGTRGHEFVMARQLLSVSLVGRHDSEHLVRAATTNLRLFVGYMERCLVPVHDVACSGPAGVYSSTVMYGVETWSESASEMCILTQTVSHG
jgi:hypothetical protein